MLGILELCESQSQKFVGGTGRREPAPGGAASRPPNAQRVGPLKQHFDACPPLDRSPQARCFPGCQEHDPRSAISFPAASCCQCRCRFRVGAAARAGKQCPFHLGKCGDMQEENPAPRHVIQTPRFPKRRFKRTPPAWRNEVPSEKHSWS